MELKGEERIGLARDEVWMALNDPQILQRCIPNCESVTKMDDRAFKVLLILTAGPVRAKFAAELGFDRFLPPESCLIRFDGKGGAAGFGRGTADVRLVEEPGGTRLCYAVTAQVGGKLAQIGSRLVDATVRKLAAEFFSRFNDAVAVPSEPATRGPDTREVPEISDLIAGARRAWWLWVLLAAGIALGFAWLLRYYIS